MSSADDLEQLIQHLDTLYHDGDDCVHPDSGMIVSDREYDLLRKKLEKLRPDSFIFQQASSSKTVSVYKKMQHSPHMRSISKACHEIRDQQEQQLFKWLADCEAEDSSGKRFDLAAKTIKSVKHKEREYKGNIFSYPRNYFCQSYKLDGVAIGLYYEDGELVTAGLRPNDGINGEDVTEQCRYVESIPQKLNLPVTCSIRGELICKTSDFAKVQNDFKEAGLPVRANPRNHCSGGIRQFKNPEKTADMRLSFIGYSIENLDSPPYETEIERAKWANQELGISFVQVRDFNFYSLQEMEDNLGDLDYEVDGVVISVNSMDAQYNLGFHGDKPSGNPRGKIAWKFEEERARVVVKEIQWSVGRTGRVVPVAVFDAVALAGTQVSRTTLHNYGFMKRNKIDVGAQLEILKSGKIIPKVVGVPVPCQGSPDYPKEVNGQATKLVEGSGGNIDLITESDESSNLTHYLRTFGVVGVGSSTVNSLMKAGKVSTPDDFYCLELSDMEESGLSERQGLLAIASIHMINRPEALDDSELAKKISQAIKVKKEVPAWKFIASLGISGVNKSTPKNLIEFYGSLEKIRDSQDFTEVPDVGEKTSDAVVSWLKDNSNVVDNLLEHVELEYPKEGPLTGMKFVLTGSFEKGKKHYVTLIEGLGGKCSSSVSKNTSYLLEGTDPGSKLEKAKKLGVSILSVPELEKKFL